MTGGGRKGQVKQMETADVGRLVDSFWRAASAISGSDRYRDMKAPVAAAARSLLKLAALGAESELRSILRPDLDVDEVTWTIVCFEIGAISPAGVHEASDVCDALASLVSCREPSHVASELVCSGPDGLQWVALARSDRRFSFQLPDAGNVAAPDVTAATVAITRWRRHLSFTEARLFVDELPGDRSGGDATPRPAAEQTVAPDAPDAVVADGTPRPPEHQPTPPTADPGIIDVREATPGSTVDPATKRRADEQEARREDARRMLRRAVATPPPGRSDIDQNGFDPDDPITNRTLSTALRSAVAEIVPFLERYLLDAVGAAIGETTTSETSGSPSEQLAGMLDALPAQIADQLRPDLRHRPPVQDPDELADALLAAVRSELHDALADIDEIQRERLRRLSDLTSALSDRQAELRTWMVALRTVEDQVERRFDQVDNHLQLFEQRVDDAVEQVRVEQRRLREVTEDRGQQPAVPAPEVERLAGEVERLQEQVATANDVLQEIRLRLLG